MKISSVSVWGDSIGKCVVFDEARGRYAICKDNYASHLKAGGVTVENHSVMGYTVCQAQLAEKDMRPGGVAAIEFGGNDCDLDWKAVSENPDVYHEARTPIGLFKDKLAEMVKKARAFDMRAVLVVPPPIDAEKYFAWVSKNLDPTRDPQVPGRRAAHLPLAGALRAGGGGDRQQARAAPCSTCAKPFWWRGTSRAFCAWTASTPRRRATSSSGAKSAA